MIAQNASVGSLDEVVEVRHGLFVTQHIGQVVSSHRPCVGVGVDRVYVGSAEEESLCVFPVGTSQLPVDTSLIESCLRAVNYCVVCIVIA